MKPQLLPFIPRTFPLLISLLILFSACGEKGIAPLSDAEKSAISSLAQSLATELTVQDPGGKAQIFTDTVSFFGLRISAGRYVPEWRRLRMYFHQFQCSPDGNNYSLDSVGKDFIQLHLEYPCSDPNAVKPMEMSRDLHLTLTRGESPKISKVEMDWRTYLDELKTESKSIEDKYALYHEANSPNFTAIGNLLETFAAKSARPAFLSRVGQEIILYLGKNGYSGFTWYTDKWEPTGQVTLADQEGNVLTEKWYDFIGSFGMLSEGLAEVRLNGKWGLIDTEGKEILAPEYDRLFPPVSRKHVAIFERKGQFAGVTVAGKPELLNGKVDWGRMIDQYDFKSRLMPSESEYEGAALLGFEGQEHGYGEYVFPPAIFVEMGIAPTALAVRMHDPGGVEAVSVTKKLETPSGFWGLISKIEEWTFGPRESYHSQTYTASTYDSTLNLISSVEIMKAGGDDLVGGYCDISEFKVIGKDTIEAKYNFKAGYNSGQSTAYNYYAIADGGRISKLTSPSDYPFLHFAKMDKNHLKGCWVEEIPEGEWSKKPDNNYDYGPWTEFWVTKHYSADEVSGMISVLEERDSLNPLESRNLAFLQGYLPEVKKNEKRLVNKQRKTVHGW